MALFLAGFPDTTSVVAINRLCSSGLESCAIIAAKIIAGTINIGIGSGVESMSVYDMNSSVNVEKISESVF
jgi:acetyl-CoA acyltransferase 1